MKFLIIDKRLYYSLQHPTETCIREYHVKIIMLKQPETSFDLIKENEPNK